jgi:hypothetical protein
MTRAESAGQRRVVGQPVEDQAETEQNDVSYEQRGEPAAVGAELPRASRTKYTTRRRQALPSARLRTAPEAPPAGRASSRPASGRLDGVKRVLTGHNHGTVSACSGPVQAVRAIPQ